MLPFRFFCPIASLDSLFSRSLPQGNSLLHRSSALHSRQNKLQHLLVSFARLLRWTSLLSRSQPLGCSLLRRLSALLSNKISFEVPSLLFCPITALVFVPQSVTTIRLLPPSSFVFLVLEQNKLRSFLVRSFVLRTKSAFGGADGTRTRDPRRDRPVF